MQELRIRATFEKRPAIETEEAIRSGLQKLMKELGATETPDVCTGGGCWWVDLSANLAAGIPQLVEWFPQATKSLLATVAGWMVGRQLDRLFGRNEGGAEGTWALDSAQNRPNRMETTASKDNPGGDSGLVGRQRPGLLFADKEKAERVRELCKSLEPAMKKAGLVRLTMSFWDENDGAGEILKLKPVEGEGQVECAYHWTNSRMDLNEQIER